MNIELIGISDDLLICLLNHGWKLMDVSYDDHWYPKQPTYTLQKPI